MEKSTITEELATGCLKMSEAMEHFGQAVIILAEKLGEMWAKAWEILRMMKEPGKMSRKRFKKLLMSTGVQRNQAEQIAVAARRNRVRYAAAWRMYQHGTAEMKNII